MNNAYTFSKLRNRFKCALHQGNFMLHTALSAGLIGFCTQERFDEYVKNLDAKIDAAYELAKISGKYKKCLSLIKQFEKILKEQEVHVLPQDINHKRQLKCKSIKLEAHAAFYGKIRRAFQERDFSFVLAKIASAKKKEDPSELIGRYFSDFKMEIKKEISDKCNQVFFQLFIFQSITRLTDDKWDVAGRLLAVLIKKGTVCDDGSGNFSISCTADEFQDLISRKLARINLGNVNSVSSVITAFNANRSKNIDELISTLYSKVVTVFPAADSASPEFKSDEYTAQLKEAANQSVKQLKLKLSEKPVLTKAILGFDPKGLRAPEFKLPKELEPLKSFYVNAVNILKKADSDKAEIKEKLRKIKEMAETARSKVKKHKTKVMVSPPADSVLSTVLVTKVLSVVPEALALTQPASSSVDASKAEIHTNEEKLSTVKSEKPDAEQKGEPTFEVLPATASQSTASLWQNSPIFKPVAPISPFIPTTSIWQWR